MNYYYLLQIIGEVPTAAATANETTSSLVEFTSVSDYALYVARLLHLPKNDKTLLATASDVFVKVALILARIHREVILPSSIEEEVYETKFE